MSQVQEVHQGTGHWSVTLNEDTPRSVREQLGFGQIVITPTHVDAEALADPDLYQGPDSPVGPDDIATLPVLMRLGRYSGVVTHVGRGDDRTLSGWGLAWYLGQDDRGAILRDRRMTAPLDTDAVLRWLLTLHVRPGQAWPAPSLWSGTVESNQTVRDALGYVLGLMGVQWRINPDATLDAGPADDLFGPGPHALAVRHGGQDVDIQSLQVASLALAEDYKDWVSDVRVVGRGENDDVVIGEAARSSPYIGPWGDELRRTALVHDSQTEASNADAHAQAVLDGMRETRRDLKLSAADYQIDKQARPGQTLAVYDPAAGVFDLDNERHWYGRVIWPLHLHVAGVTWPIVDGMGVYWTYAGDIVDLTDHVDWAQGDTTVSVGDAPRSLTQRRDVREANRARTRGGPLYLGGGL